MTALSDEEQARVRRERIGFVFQFFHLVPRLTAQENIELPMALAGIAAEQRHARSRELLVSYGLPDRAHHRPEQLSGGQRQRVAIARATVMRPGLLLADEPTGNLDRNSGKEVVQILEASARAGGDAHRRHPRPGAGPAGAPPAALAGRGGRRGSAQPMRPQDILRFAWGSLRGYPSRTVLMAIAMAIGVGAVIVLTGSGRGCAPLRDEPVHLAGHQPA